MKLSINGIKEQEAWKKAGIALPGYDVEAASEKAKENPVWVHFGIGNIFRIFIGGIADGLLEEGILDRGITCVENIYDTKMNPAWFFLCLLRNCCHIITRKGNPCMLPRFLFFNSIN